MKVSREPWDTKLATIWWLSNKSSMNLKDKPMHQTTKRKHGKNWRLSNWRRYIWIVSHFKYAQFEENSFKGGSWQWKWKVQKITSEIIVKLWDPINAKSHLPTNCYFIMLPIEVQTFNVHTTIYLKQLTASLHLQYIEHQAYCLKLHEQNQTRTPLPQKNNAMHTI